MKATTMGAKKKARAQFVERALGDDLEKILSKLTRKGLWFVLESSDGRSGTKKKEKFDAEIGDLRGSDGVFSGPTPRGAVMKALQAWRDQPDDDV